MVDEEHGLGELLYYLTQEASNALEELPAGSWDRLSLKALDLRWKRGQAKHDVVDRDSEGEGVHRARSRSRLQTRFTYPRKAC